MKEYLAWEHSLIAPVERDGTARFESAPARRLKACTSPRSHARPGR
jgi:hypothetical protein